jgi:hypothetical protein
MLSFDVYGTLVNTPPANLGVFRAILADAGRLDIVKTPLGGWNR